MGGTINRFDPAALMKETETELFRPGGNFDTLFGHDPETVNRRVSSWLSR